MDTTLAADSVAPAFCPEHPAVAATTACARCGRFLCEECRRGDDLARCAPCETLATDALGLRARPPSVAAFRDGGGALFLAGARTVLPIWIVAIASSEAAYRILEQTHASPADAWRIGILIGSVFRTWARGASIAAFLGVAEGKPLSHAEAWQQGFFLFGRMLTTQTRVGLSILLNALLLLVPGVMRACTLAVASAAAVHRRVFDPVRISEDTTRGYRKAVAAVLLTVPVVALVLKAMFGLGANALVARGAPSLLLLPLSAALPATLDTYIDALTVATYLPLDGAQASKSRVPQVA